MKTYTFLLERTERFFLVGLFAMLVGLTLTQIVLRNIFESGLVWADDAIKVLVLWIAMMGALYATRGAHHISIDVMTRFLSSKWEKNIKRFLFLLSAMICGIASWFSYQFILLEFEYPTEAFLSIPSWVTQAIIPLALGLMALRFLSLIIWFPEAQSQASVIESSGAEKP